MLRLYGFADYLLDPGDDVFAIRVLFEGGEMRLDLLDDHIALLVVNQIEHLLDDVVRVLVFHHHLQRCDTNDT